MFYVWVADLNDILLCAQNQVLQLCLETWLETSSGLAQRLGVLSDAFSSSSTARPWNCIRRWLLIFDLRALGELAVLHGKLIRCVDFVSSIINHPQRSHGRMAAHCKTA